MKAATLNKQCFSGPLGDVRGDTRSGAQRTLASHHPRRHVIPTSLPEAAPQAPRPAAEPQAAPLHAAHTNGSQQSPRVLHIDSDPVAASALASLLTPDARVVHVATVAAARRLLQSELFSLVVLDPGLSDGDGAALLPALSSTPLLVYSARQPDWRGQPGAYLPKPWTSSRQLWSTISRMLGIASGLTAGD